MDNEKRKERQQKFNDELKYMLLYVGFAGAIISAVAYMIMTIVMINGFQSSLDIEKQIMFSVLSSLIGLVISFLLRSQGIAFAKNEEQSKIVMKNYYEALNKKKTVKKLKTITYYMVRATIIDVIVKGTLFIASMWGIIYMFSEGNGDWSLLGLALSNILMFAGFGLVALSKMYDKYLDEHISVIKELTKKLTPPSEVVDTELIE